MARLRASGSAVVIICANPKAQYEAHKAEIDDALAHTLESGMYVLGENVRAFESEFAHYLGASDGVGVGSGTEAIHLALRALDIGPGSEVITVSHTAVATVAAIELAGATPVFVDIEPATFGMRPELVESRISPKTKAIIPVHLYGLPVRLDPILELARAHGLHVIEDCAQAHGAMLGSRRVGTLGVVGCFSFYPTKNLGALGDGGMAVTSDPVLAERMRQLREYGWTERYVSSHAGWNTRLDEIQAAVLRVKLRYLDADNAARRSHASAYSDALLGTPLVLPTCPMGRDHVFHLYVVRSKARDQLLTELRGRKIGALIHYPMPIHLQPAYAGRIRGSDELHETEQAAREVVSLPMYPELSEADRATTISAIRDAIG